LNKLENFAKKHIGSTDYRNASEMMRKILVNTVNLDITEDVKKIKCPTLIVWGTYDEAVPLEDAYELEKLIKGSGVVVYEGCSHYAYLERLGQTINVINSFLESR
jgi:pimeloyl-ACP methyl ester carboxylesterase